MERQGHETISEDDEDIQPRRTFSLALEGGYSFATKLFDFEGGEYNVTEIKGEIRHKGKKVGSVNGWLINRGWRSNFFTSCDSVSSELQLLANVLFHQSGRLNKHQWEKEIRSDALQACSHGGFLNIDVVSISKPHRGKDLGIQYLQHLFHALQGQWTISVVVPYVEDSDVPDESEANRLNHVCQLLARCGYKFLPIETNTSYWYLLPGELKNLSKLEVHDVRHQHISNEHWSDYKNSLHSIHSMACFEEALVVGYEEFRKRPNDRARALKRYSDCLALMPTHVKGVLIEGLVSPRMFEHLLYTIEIQADQTRMELEDLKPRVPIKVENCFISMLEYIPKDVRKNGLTKTFVSGLAKVMETMATIMRSNTNRLPTTNRVMKLLEATWPPSHRTFFEKGGRLEHLYHGIIDVSKEQSWAYGDGTYDEVFSMDEEKLPSVDILDTDFHFVETIVVKYLQEN